MCTADAHAQLGEGWVLCTVGAGGEKVCRRSEKGGGGVGEERLCRGLRARFVRAAEGARVLLG